MDRDPPGPGHAGQPADWGLRMAIPLVLLCCGGPVLVGLLGAGARAAACCPPASEVRRAAGTAGTPAPESALVGRPARKP